MLFSIFASCFLKNRIAMCRYISVIGCFILSVVGPLAMAQQVLTLDDCHRLALESNSQIKILDEKRQSAEDMRKLALTEFFPRVSANGLYHWSSRNVEILSDDQKTRLSTLGDQATALVGKSLSTRAGKWVWDNAMAQASTKMAAGMNEMGQQFVNDFEIDTRNVFVGAVTVTQPIYLGGKIREAYRIAQLNAELSGLTYDVQQEALLVSIDEAYWRVVSLEHKVQLAEQYVKLLEDGGRGCYTCRPDEGARQTQRGTHEPDEGIQRVGTLQDAALPTMRSRFGWRLCGCRRLLAGEIHGLRQYQYAGGVGAAFGTEDAEYR